MTNRTVTTVCKLCQETFTYERIGRYRLFCSFDCKERYIDVRRGYITLETATRRVRAIGTTRHCPLCSTPFTVRQGVRQVFCSYECNKKAQQIRASGGTPEQYRIAMREQDSKCKMCGVIDKLNVDHDHKTGKFRGLLCTSCNIGLGWYEGFKDKAERYLASCQ